MSDEQTRQIAVEDIQNLRRMHAQQFKRIVEAKERGDGPAGYQALNEIVSSHLACADMLDVVEYQLARLTDLERERAADAATIDELTGHRDRVQAGWNEDRRLSDEAIDAHMARWKCAEVALAASEQRAARLVEALEAFEWLPERNMKGTMTDFCTVCGGTPSMYELNKTTTRPDGHRLRTLRFMGGCPLAKALDLARAALAGSAVAAERGGGGGESRD